MTRVPLDAFEAELILGPRRQAKIAWATAATFGGLSLLLTVALVVMLPLKSSEVFTVLVDKTTGQAERIVEVAPMTLAEDRAVKEALLVAYVTDREGFIRQGIQQRLESVQRRSSGQARESLVRLWTASGNPDYPPAIYGEGAVVNVKVRAISFLSPSVAQVRLVKTLLRNGTETAAPFIATVEFDFAPRRERTLELVWENPLGFSVRNYAVTAETLEGTRR
ncbi:virB8 family protein [Haematobacter genomosp. 1]|uniref:Type IV secretion system protein VirB8 n=1 Tax=Haematobacter genomosp. 1 TaxID=366618 RepID=A0A212AAF7_9RHOB|nr:type IV secretion system protein [Haematobacter genomosp. 1]OWJ77142.1 type IV secretion system protein VirB8 [Haematobacter genomosp. 1]